MARPLAVILGAGPGIGLALARRLAQEGFDLAVVVRPGEDQPRFQTELASRAARVQVLAADLADPRALAEALAAIQAQSGWPELMIYNASAGTVGPADRLTAPLLQADLQVNVGSPLAAAQWALTGMRQAGRGSLLFTGGGLALQPKPGLASACLGKAALRSLALSLGQELAPEGIHAATVTVAGFVQAGTALSPERVAEAFLELHGQTNGQWQHELTVP